MQKEFIPKLFSLLKQGISKDTLIKDIISGIIVGIVALPLAIAFAIASGVSPEKGIVTAIIAGIIISTFGGSRVQIGGPTGAFVVIVYGIVQEYGTDGLTIATFMAGFIIIGFGLARLGNLLKYIPYSLIVGFTSGIAVIIFSSQINDFFGLHITKVPADFMDKWVVYFNNFHKINWYAIGIAVATIFTTLYFQKIIKKLPGSIIAIVLSTIAVTVFHIPVDTIESNFGSIPNQIGLPRIPKLDFDTIQALIQPAFAIAILGSIESLLSAVVSDSMIGGKHRTNMELVAQGAANIMSSLFGGIPATGAIARTATNVKNGGRTPIAGIVHALVLLAIMLLFAPYAKLIPMSCLAGILMVVAYHMSEWKQFRSILKGNRMDIIILLTTFLLTVIFDLVIAIEIGIVLSSFMFMKRMSESVNIQGFSSENGHEEHLFDDELLEIPKGVILYEINGPLFFGAARQFQETITNTHFQPQVIIIRMRYVPLIDATGYQSIKEILKSYQARKINVIISGVSTSLMADFEKNDIFSFIDRAFVVDDIHTAIEKAQENV
ncbi:MULTISPECIES: SulP family inorganic anion transporter [Bizionia]|uniref:STAS domain-containing protein n=1 Tax=Bizionia algoritergicola TaxID=291187 RepID=A0A5D0QT70_9FLAO|nr:MULTISPECIES: SulP family inorganic anion transporter [Bizionia]OBX22116.1 sodium-independent anion transporter [Bizionia sp. APA-3]TYB72337.1 STAS domain-containing protein [Bizionia algoritergicola]